MHHTRPLPATSTTRFVLPWLLALLLLVSAPFAFAKTYVDNFDGTVTDPSTGLTWMRCAMGQTWTGSTCSGVPSGFSMIGTVTFAGYDDWRLPSIRELLTIVDRSVDYQTIDSTVFANIKIALLLSGTLSYPGNLPWGVSLESIGYYYGGTYFASICGRACPHPNALLVRGGQSFGSLLNIARPTSDYVDHGDGTVTHTPTNLTWKRCAEGQIWSGTTCTGEALRYNFDQANALTGTTAFADTSDWRLPTEEELLSLVDYSTNAPTINTSIFPATPRLTSFWSSSPVMGRLSPSSAWLVTFDEGTAYSDKRDNGNAVRLVRGGPSWGTTAPTCTISYSPLVILPGTSVTLVANCTPAATRYTWSDNACPGATGATCTVTPMATTSYSVVGVNAVTSKSATASSTVTVATPPTSTLQANVDGTVTDIKTGLVWMRCAVGMIWTGSTCTGTASTYTLEQTRRLNDVVTFADMSDWRIPTIRELQTIVNSPARKMVINSIAFPDTPNTPFWSSTADAFFSLDWAWAIDFSNGFTYETSSYAAVFSSRAFYALRLVRGGESAGSLLGITRPTSDYVDHGDGTVTHTPTNLTWKRCAEGQTWTGGTCSGKASAYTSDQANALTGATAFAGASDWRVPTEEELLSLADYSIAYPGPTINSKIFPAVSEQYFWSSSPSTDDPSSPLVVEFSSGRIRSRYMYEKNPVRLVRGGKSFDAVAPSCILSASSVVLAVGASTTLTARCTPEATSYAWTNSGFGSTTASGTVSPTATTRYSVVGSNAAGSGIAATAEVYVCNTPPLQNYSGLILSGTTHSDQIAGAMGNDTVDGLAGIDTVVYNCNRANFTVNKTASGGWRVSSQAEGLDTLSNVERVRFGDETVALDISGNAGQAYRLYQAAFDRKPDNGGLKYWINEMDKGMALREVAARFIDSDEFRQLYGTNPNNADFLTRLYNNVLHRTPDAGGYAWWLDQLDTGLHTQTTALMGFAESPENQAGVLNAIMNGIDLLN